MTFQRQDHLAEMKEYLVRLELHIRMDILLRHQNSHIELEVFFRDLLNQTFGWKLGNANAKLGPNQDSFDLFDEHGNVAVQVTVTTTADKIKKTLKGFIGKYAAKYKRLIFVYPVIDVPESQGKLYAIAERLRLRRVAGSNRVRRNSARSSGHAGW